VLARTVRAAWGGLLVIDPNLPLALGGGLDSRGVRAAVRILGARHVVEAVVLGGAQASRARRRIRAIDAIHALSMVALAAVSPRLRRDALLSAASATGLVVLSLTED
jgi:hypothetical protein